MGNYNCKKKSVELEKIPKFSIQEYLKFKFRKDVKNIENLHDCELKFNIIQIDNKFYNIFDDKIEIYSFIKINLMDRLEYWNDNIKIEYIKLFKEINKDYIYLHYYKKDKPYLFESLEINFGLILEYFRYKNLDNKILNLSSKYLDLKERKNTKIKFKKWTTDIEILKKIIGCPVLEHEYFRYLLEGKYLNLHSVVELISYELFFSEKCYIKHIFKYLTKCKIENIDTFEYIGINKKLKVLDYISINEYLDIKKNNYLYRNPLIKESLKFRELFEKKFKKELKLNYEKQTDLLFNFIIFLGFNSKLINTNKFHIYVNELYLYLIKNNRHIKTVISLYNDIITFNKYVEFEETKEYNENIYFSCIKNLFKEFCKKINEKHLEHGKYVKIFMNYIQFKSNDKSLYICRNNKIVDTEYDIELFKNILSFYVLGTKKNKKTNYRYKFIFKKNNPIFDNLKIESLVKSKLNWYSSLNFENIQIIHSHIPLIYQQFILKLEQEYNMNFNKKIYSNKNTFVSNNNFKNDDMKTEYSFDLNKKLEKEQNIFYLNQFVNTLPKNNGFM